MAALDADLKMLVGVTRSGMASQLAGVASGKESQVEMPDSTNSRPGFERVSSSRQCGQTGAGAGICVKAGFAP
jgi:hypothetical protein